MAEKVKRSLGQNVTVVSMTVIKCFGWIRGSGVKTNPGLPFDVIFVGEAYAPSAEAAMEGVKLAEFADTGFKFGDVVRMVQKGCVVGVNFRVTTNGWGVGEESEIED